VVVYGVIDSRDELGKHPFGDVLGVYLHRPAAEQELRAIIGHEAGWEAFMSLVEFELTTGNRN
jgi:hypothetical protein